jgi:hypothetical protein
MPRVKRTEIFRSKDGYQRFQDTQPGIATSFQQQVDAGNAVAQPTTRVVEGDVTIYTYVTIWNSQEALDAYQQWFNLNYKALQEEHYHLQKKPAGNPDNLGRTTTFETLED